MKKIISFFSIFVLGFSMQMAYANSEPQTEINKQTVINCDYLQFLPVILFLNLVIKSGLLMRFLKIFFLFLLILLGIFFIGGLMIPDTWTVSRSTMIKASPEQIYPYVATLKEFNKWNPWNTSSDSTLPKNASNDTTLKYTFEGPEMGVGAKQSWTSTKMGQGWMKIIKADPRTGMTYAAFVDMDNFQIRLIGDLVFNQQGKETKVTWTDTVSSDNNLIKRWFSLLFKPQLGKDFEIGLAALKSTVEKSNKSEKKT